MRAHGNHPNVKAAILRVHAQTLDCRPDQSTWNGTLLTSVPLGVATWTVPGQPGDDECPERSP